ncbi:unnamed protein product [Periconia digitata]|uniref:Secreted protein n=1 Tax=Periconia digitata TaxID=1303443 RepID=A0A9W4XSA0_9PLEO|nr:unnamed protein product [Periconia digitata]
MYHLDVSMAGTGVTLLSSLSLALCRRCCKTCHHDDGGWCRRLKAAGLLFQSSRDALSGSNQLGEVLR